MFHNPYNFVPAPPRSDDPGDGELGNRPPVGHDRFHDGYFTGRITVKMTVATPLLIPDAALAKPLDPQQPKGHRTYPLRLGPDGRPLIPPTSLKGMLRSAYEAVTNSRFGVFSRKHRLPLAYRMDPNEGLSLVPARIENGRIRLMLGTNRKPPYKDSSGKWAVPNERLLYAAWLPLVEARTHGVKHRVPVRVRITRFDRKRITPNSESFLFSYWRVDQILSIGSKTTSIVLPPCRLRGHFETGETRTVDGFACITNRNMDNKHDERVFFDPPGQHPDTAPLDESLKERWRLLIEDYQIIHRNEIMLQGRTGPPACQQNTIWSRHVTEDLDRESGLSEGTLCYAHVNKERTGNYAVLGLFPVSISRGLHDVSPSKLLPPGLKPAATLEKLSPADRVFGWVRQNEGPDEPVGGAKALDPGPGASKGQLRICRVECLTPPGQAIEHFGRPGVPLAILGEPKPQQARFYMAEDKEGSVLEPATQPRYVNGRGLRGRKVYPHHEGLDKQPEYWQNASSDRTQQKTKGYYQEYARPHPSEKEEVLEDDGSVVTRAKLDPGQDRRTTFVLDTSQPEKRRDDQNRSVQAWVKPGTEFKFVIELVNLSMVELGALLFLLCLPSEQRPHVSARARHRFGGGKPLGFGSIRLEIEAMSVQDGAALRESYIYVRLGGAEPSKGVLRLSLDDTSETIEKYKSAIVDAYGTAVNPEFEEIPFIAAFLRSCWGFRDSHRTHYPRARQPGQEGNYLPPHPDGNGYEWFVANKRETERKSLPNLTADHGLDYLDAR